MRSALTIVIRRPYPRLVLLCLAFLIISLARPASATELDQEGTEAFRAAILRYQAGDFANSAPALLRARRILPILGDYAALYAAEAYLSNQDASGAHEALKLINTARTTVPLRQRARALEARLALTGDWDRALLALSDYAKDYPSDYDMKLTYADHLKKRGRTEQADALYLEIYRNAGPRSELAYEAHSTKKFEDSDLLVRAVTLMSKFNHAQAEPLLRQLLKSGTLPALPLKEQLALTLFRQRKYDEAARLYSELDDLYNAGRSYLRSGQDYEFYRTVDRMIDRKDDQAGDLMIAMAIQLRREGDYANALSILSDAAALFPKSREDALWYSAWTNYLRGNFNASLETLLKLSLEFKSNKYYYWLGRTRQKLGLDPTEIYADIKGQDYYAYLAALALGRPYTESTAPAYKPGASVARPPASGLDPKEMLRAEALILVGLQADAARELWEMAAGCSSSAPGTIELARMMQRAGKFRDAMLLIARLPLPTQPEEILYPLAFWETVGAEALRHGMDPLLLLSVMREESKFDPEVISPAGAHGLMQLMPNTARRLAPALALRIPDNAALLDARNNVKLGAHYLGSLLRRFDHMQAAIAAYNAGENAVTGWLKRGAYLSADEFVEDIPYRETRNYVKRILGTYYIYKSSPAALKAAEGAGQLEGRASVNFKPSVVFY